VSIRQILTRLRRDESGSYIIYMSLLMPAAIGIAGLGTEGGLMLFNHRSLQSAADSAAVSVASYYATNTSASSGALAGQANAVAANYGYVNGTNGVTVTVNNPPTSGDFAGNTHAFEVIVTKPQAPIGPGVLQAQMRAERGAALGLKRAIALRQGAPRQRGHCQPSRHEIAVGGQDGGRAGFLVDWTRPPRPPRQ